MTPETLFFNGALVLFVLVLVWKFSHRRKTQSWMEVAVCTSCGWNGQTSRYAGRCPRCNAAIGEQRATRPN